MIIIIAIIIISSEIKYKLLSSLLSIHRKGVKDAWGYKEDKSKKGVYRSEKQLFRWITIISVRKS